MARRMKTQLSTKALSLCKQWAVQIHSPPISASACIRQAPHADAGQRRYFASTQFSKVLCSVSDSHETEVRPTIARSAPIAASRNGESPFEVNSVYPNGKMCHCCVPGYKKRENYGPVHEKISYRHHFTTIARSAECCQRDHIMPLYSWHREYANSSYGERSENSPEAAKFAEQASANNEKGEEISFTGAKDENSVHPKAVETRSAGDGGVEAQADGESDAVGTDDEDEDGTRLERVEQEYLEALASGDVGALDLQQLEDLLGQAPAGDATVGTLYLRLGQEYDATGESAENILRCGKKALAIFQTQTEDVRLQEAMALHLIGIAYVKQEKFEKSLPILRQAIHLFESKGGEDSNAAKCAVRVLLGEALFSWGKADEAVDQLKLAVSDQEGILGPGHVQLATGYRRLAEVLANVMKQEEALGFAKKALEIHIKANGSKSLDEAVDRRLLAVIYIGLEEHEKALVEHKIVRDILEKSEHGSQTVFVDISLADTEITLGKYDDAILSLETALSKVEKGSAMHALALVNIAKVYERKKQPELADKYAKDVLEILESRVLSNADPLAVAEGFTELATLYEKIDKTDGAIEMLKRAHEIYDGIPHQRNAAAGTQAQIGMLLFFTGKVEEALPYLEKAAANLEGAVGEHSFPLAMVLNHLGVACVELERLEPATEHFERAKSIFIKILGSDHDDTIAVSRNLVNVYSLLDRLSDAIRVQSEVVNELRDKGSEAPEMLEDALAHLQLLREHEENGKLMSETLETDPRKFGRTIID